ncbi:hypothetical protein QQF64_009880 [Cirrhinus molitorella]|uniref:Uncharacterized protein n=1 Tax=Cirrhinus molitorella TaxID=172907 RepID=A0ABR3M2F3_9TELE
MFVPLPVPFVLPRTASDLHAWRLKSPLALRSHSGKAFFQSNHPLFSSNSESSDRARWPNPRIHHVNETSPFAVFCLCCSRLPPFPTFQFHFSLVQPTRVNFLRAPHPSVSSSRLCLCLRLPRTKLAVSWEYSCQLIDLRRIDSGAGGSRGERRESEQLQRAEK